MVGRSHECDYPESVQSLPVCTSSRIDSSQSSDKIHGQVQHILSQALSLYQVDAEKIRELAPDVIITQTQCDVCAVSFEDVEKAVRDMTDKPIDIISLNPHRLDDILEDIKTVGERLDAPDKTAHLLDELYERIELVKHKLKFIEQKPAVACIEWLSPLMISGNWVPELVEIAGGVPVLAEKGKFSPVIQFEQLQEVNPDIMVLMTCGFPVSRTLQEIGILPGQPGWSELKAVQNNRVYVADGNRYFNRPGPSVIDSMEILAEIINPKQFIFGYEGNGWVKFTTN